MHESTIAKRYATALAELASELNILDSIRDELAHFQALLAESPEMHEMMVSPTVSKESQHKLISTYLEYAKPNDLTANFLRLLIDKHRMALLNDVATAIVRVVDERAGRIQVKVETPKALTPSLVAKLEKSLADVTGKEVSLEISEKPELLGGLVIRMGSVMLDDSLRTQLHRLKEIMKG
ncbi:ATP synthase F1 subcomplex delta subunit [Magnetococcus marinus MC-1]|uniref:ATP synthase F1 subunit delta n=1 Tax=Magnetococcus marinus TaxID=1124597 RepID=UPI00003C56A8|nr:ATP synthase F1 subunit delta [Magnetococcus marinus]ABK45946.1 ATP synthase F1 subcomplex delta subunit [Magnetococcus marinus MC-1]